MVSGKTAEYKLFWKGLGGVGIFLAKKWINKVVDISRVSDSPETVRNCAFPQNIQTSKLCEITVFSQCKVLVQENIISVIPVYAPQGGLDDSQKKKKKDFYDSFISVVRMLREKAIVVTEGDLNGPPGCKP